MEVFSLNTDIPKGKSSTRYGLLSVLRTRAVKNVGLFKIGLTALVFGLASISWQFWKSNLYDDGLNAEKIVNVLKSRKSKDFILAANYYTNGQKIEATEIVSQHYKMNPNDVQLAVVYAQMLTSDGYFHVSRCVLNSVFSKANYQQKGETAFLMAITYLKEENYQDCKLWLTKIDKQSLCYKQAQQLLIKIKPFVSS
ncbi:hypothetical protein [Nubsella zeaxanthinifaciens]|jgi:hypothetical protein|uniref:hypothetical protein n=1 Tax=Nubsella zeaxanthinifaciens TaxID=392412 RepID=UPI000DE3388C|nr:hypothetical protein [Nubsella zeaxanthinifaciens]